MNSSPIEAVARIGREFAAPAAVDVDARARFPSEAIDALKREGLLGAAVPRELGGLGCTVAEMARMCAALGQHCASSAMIFAMHQIQVACIARHALSSPFFRSYLSRVAKEQRLVASVTSEVGVGGDTRTSLCAVDVRGEKIVLEKAATTISYGEEADDLLVTCRRAPDAPGSDQVLVLLMKGDYALERTSVWDTLGMRGTCSPGFILTSAALVEQIVPGSFADSSSATMVPFSHVLWSSVWLGIATDATVRASAFVRAEARKKPGTVPPGATRLAELTSSLQAMRIHVNGVAEDCAQAFASGDSTITSSVAFALKLNALKTFTSECVVRVVHQAMLVCGIMGYKNSGPMSLGRHLRDAHSAALMINNDRIFAKSAALHLVQKEIEGQ
jgi:acyl-CoA dehydrogenase